MGARPAPTPPSQRLDGGVGAHLEAWSKRGGAGWLVRKVEEEKAVREIVAKFHMVRNDSSALLDLDRELGARAPETAAEPRTT